MGKDGWDVINGLHCQGLSAKGIYWLCCLDGQGHVKLWRPPRGYRSIEQGTETSLVERENVTLLGEIQHVQSKQKDL